MCPASLPVFPAAASWLQKRLTEARAEAHRHLQRAYSVSAAVPIRPLRDSAVRRLSLSRPLSPAWLQWYESASALLGLPTSPLVFAAATAVTARVFVRLLRSRLSLFRALRLLLLALLVSATPLTPPPVSSSPTTASPLPPPLSSQSASLLSALAPSYWGVGSQVFALASVVLPFLASNPQWSNSVQRVAGVVHRLRR